MEADEGSDQKADIQPHWMAAHARLNNEFTEDEKCHNLIRSLISFLFRLIGMVGEACLPTIVLPSNA